VPQAPIHLQPGIRLDNSEQICQVGSSGTAADIGGQRFEFCLTCHPYNVRREVLAGHRQMLAASLDSVQCRTHPIWSQEGRMLGPLRQRIQPLAFRHTPLNGALWIWAGVNGDEDTLRRPSGSLCHSVRWRSGSSQRMGRCVSGVGRREDFPNAFRPRRKITRRWRGTSLPR
jgi:hypothetical protein